MPIKSKPNPTTLTNTRQEGFTLLEVLVTILIVAIGLLGLAGMQTAGLRNNNDAYMRSQATLMAYDMADRMRANRQAFSEGVFHNIVAQENTACLTVAGCADTTSMARHNVFEWQEAIQELLPGGQGWICIDSTPYDGNIGSPACDGNGETYAIKIWWNEDRDSATDDQLFVTSVLP